MKNKTTEQNWRGKRPMFSILALALTACNPLPLTHPQAQATIVFQQQNTSLMPISQALEQAQQIARQWQPQAYLVSAFSYRFSGRYFVNLDFQNGGARELSVKIFSDGQIKQSEAAARGKPSALNPPWQLNTTKLLKLALEIGLDDRGDFSIGLSDFVGMGIPTAGPKWSVMPLTGASGFLVVDDATQKRWFCDQVTADSGCEAMKNHILSQSLRGIE